MKKPDQIVFYTIDKCIKTYRQMGQSRISEAGIDLTVDQWLVMNVVRQDPAASQNQIAAHIFKDGASVTRIIDLLVDKGYLKRSVSGDDRRRSMLILTARGKKLLLEAEKVVKKYRKEALRGISDAELEKVRSLLQRIIDNCD